jgi:DNA polymerase I-like protein with 3'-5' exonuclease and polymerase domains
MEKIYQWFPETKTYKEIQPHEIVLSGLVLYWDTETTGLSWVRDKIFMHSFGDENNTYLIDVREGTGVVTETLYSVLRDSNVIKRIYNAKFDAQMIYKEGINVCNMQDVFIYAKLFPKHFVGGYKLKDHIVPQLLGETTEEKDAVSSFFKGTPAAHKTTSSYIYTIQQGLFTSDDDKVINKVKTKVKREKQEKQDKDYTKLPEEILIPYAAEDIVLMRKVMDKMMLDAAEHYEQVQDLLDLEHNVQPVIIKIERAGLAVDEQLLKSVQPEIDAKAEAALNQFYDLSGADRATFDPYSPEHLQELFYDKLGEKVSGLTDAGYKLKQKKGFLAPEEMRKYASTDKWALKKFKHPCAKYLEQYNIYDVIANGFIPNLLENSVDGIIYANFNQLGAISGRMSCSDPNLENIPAKGEGEVLRKSIIARPGYNLLKIDASQIEYRIFAHYVGDASMIQSFKDGVDYHQRTAELMGVERRDAKTLNFGLIYGMGVQTLADALAVDYNVAQTLFDTYFKRIPKIKSLRYKIKDVVRQRGYVRTLLGRRRYLTNDKSYIGMNAIVQGTAADIFKMMVVAVDRFLTAGGYKTRIINLVHDEILFELWIGEEHIIPELKRIMKSVVSTEKDTGVPQLLVPLDVVASVGKNWLETEEVK